MEITNVFAIPPDLVRADAEHVETLRNGGSFRLERIVSTGQASPPDFWYDQDEDEWVVLLSGAARLEFRDPAEQLELRPGDSINIPAHRPHRIDWTHPTMPSVWLALHYR